MLAKITQPLLPGERTNSAGKPIKNRILLSLPDREFALIRPSLHYLDLPHHCILHEPNRRIEFVYFPNSGMLSLVVAAADGRAVEVGVVGNEGLAGTLAAVGIKRSPLQEIVQIEGEGFRVTAAQLQNVLRSAPSLLSLLNRYSALLGLQVSQTAACNRLHGIEQRLARWLLLAQDRVEGGALAITHDFLAEMLGTDRPSVSIAAGRLQKGKAIECTRGGVNILDRKRLEGRACECYDVIRHFSSKLI